MKKKRNQTGQSLVEYVALTALVAIVSIGTVKVFGGKIRSRLNQITNTFDKNVQQGLSGRGRARADDDGNEPQSGFGIKLPGGWKLPKGMTL